MVVRLCDGQKITILTSLTFGLVLVISQIAIFSASNQEEKKNSNQHSKLRLKSLMKMNIMQNLLQNQDSFLTGSNIIPILSEILRERQSCFLEKKSKALFALISSAKSACLRNGQTVSNSHVI